MTSDLVRRVTEHKHKLGSAFGRKHHVTKLVYYEQADTAIVAIEREKQIKGWLRTKWVALVESVNLGWKDLSHEFLL